MSAGKILLKILKPNNFRKARKFYLAFKHRLYPKLTEEQFSYLLRNRLGLKQGMTVFVHSAADNLNLAFPFYRVLPILQDVVGKEGTLLFPCWHFNYRAEEYLKKGGLFDVKRSPSVMGLLPELARRMKDARRSLHPVNSVVALGTHAEELTRDHINSVYPDDENSPFYRIVNYGGIIIGLGVSTEHMSFVHCVEDIMKERFPVKTRTDELYTSRVRDEKGSIMEVMVKAAHQQIRLRNIEAYIRKNIPPSICRDFRINGTKYFVADAANLFDKMHELALKGITIYTPKADIMNEHEISKDA
jgi:aminoglycoside N3'-acetyltransferase